MKKLLFSHLPKTAGTSFVHFLGKIYGSGNVTRTILPHEYGQYSDELSNYLVVCGHFSVQPALPELPQHALITILRDPVERSISWYRYLLGLEEPSLIPLEHIRFKNDAREAISLAHQLTPEQFFTSNHPHILQNIGNRCTWQFGGEVLKEQRGENNMEKVYSIAVNTLQQAEFILKYEQLTKDFARFCDEICQEANATDLPTVNVSRGKIGSHDLSPECIRKIEALNKYDIRLYNHLFS